MRTLAKLFRAIRHTRLDVALACYLGVWAAFWSVPLLLYCCGLTGVATLFLEPVGGLGRIAAFIYGVFRGYSAVSLHAGRPYSKWLAHSAWNPAKPLPFGSPRLGWHDLVFLATIVATLVNDPLQPPPVVMVPLMFCAGYSIFALLECMRTRFVGAAYAYALSLGAAIVLLPDSPTFAAVMLTAVWITIAQLVFGRAIVRFFALQPEAAPLLEVKSNSPQSQPTVGWPYRALLVEPTEYRVPWKLAIGIAGMCAWLYLAVTWAVLRWCANYSLTTQARYDEITLWGLGAAVGLVVIFAVVRLVRFKEYRRSPLSLSGRFFTGRFLIPGHDIVFVAPLLAVLWAFAIPSALLPFHTPLPLTLALTVGVGVALNLAMPPSLVDWYYTGRYRAHSPSTKAN